MPTPPLAAAAATCSSALSTSLPSPATVAAHTFAVVAAATQTFAVVTGRPTDASIHTSADLATATHPFAVFTVAVDYWYW